MHRGRPPSSKTLVDRQLGRNIIHPILPANDFIVPNHSGDHSAGRVDSTPVDDLDLVNKKYVDDNNNTAGNEGEIQFNASNEHGADSGLVWDNTGKRLGIGTNNPGVDLHIKQSGTPSIIIEDTSSNKQLAIAVSNDNVSFATLTDDEVLWATGGQVRMKINSGLAGDIDIQTGELNLITEGINIKNDDKKLTFGDNADCSIYFDGTHLIVDTQEVGTGDLVLLTGQLGIGDTTPAYMLDILAGSETYASYWKQPKAAMLLGFENTTAVSTSNTSGFEYRLKTSTATRTAARMTAGFSTTTDASRTSELKFWTNNGGSFINPITFKGDSLNCRKLDVSEGVSLNIVAKTANYTATTSDHTITCGAGNQTFTVTLPPVLGLAGLILNIKNVGTGTITVDGDGAETIDGAATAILSSQYDAITIQCNGVTWWII